MAIRAHGKTKVWRKEACPRHADDGRKIKGKNRKDKENMKNMKNLPVGLHPFTWALFKRAGLLLGA